MKRQMRINFWRFISPSMAVYALLPIVTFLQTIWIIQKDVSLWLFAIDGIITAASIATLCSKFKRNRELIVNKQHINSNKSFSWATATIILVATKSIIISNYLV